MTFMEMLRNRWQKANSMACVGLDSDYPKIPESCHGKNTRETMAGFNKSVVSATHDSVCAFKPNSAFYEGEWFPGLEAMADTFDFIRGVDSTIPIIWDAKRTDIGNTNKGYAKVAFDVLGADAITVNPYFGGEALKPFLDRADKGVIVLCRTSNPGAKDFQGIRIYLNDLTSEEEKFFSSLDGAVEDGGLKGSKYIRLYQLVAYRASTEWNKNGNILLVVGATYPEELRKVRKIVGDMPLLIPGIGAQAGDLEATVKAGLDSTGFGMIINSARGIIFASKEGFDYELVSNEAKKLRDQINEIKASTG